MPRTHFHDELDRLELQLLTMGELAAVAVRGAVDALLEHDDAKAMSVIAGDDEVDSLFVEIDQGVLSLLALQAPVAGDLRLMSVLMHSSGHLERIADQAVNIAKLYEVTEALPTSQAILQMLGEMGDVAVAMVRSAMEAFRRRDVEMCERLPEMDDPLDRLNRHMHLEVAKLADDPRALDWGMHMNMVARALERVGDNAVDVGEQVGFLLTGEYREFTDASERGIIGDED
ncbi:MAG: phosphate transport system regulatory protein PhoU [Actinobacteria bacterium RBG_19FT_COMBO_70_19]|jgi:phosphate transport system protein|nr:MAG: phosphate transport system regulatory protein PhoU [Actinobacteria bacterium RBG_19FT_COMBO_70_19]